MKNPIQTARTWYASFETRALDRLSPEERAEALQLDRLLKANLRSFVAGFVGVVALFAVALHLMNRRIGLIEAALLATILVGCVGFGLLSAWAGARRKRSFGRNGFRTVVAIIALSTFGAIGGMILGSAGRNGWAATFDISDSKIGVVIGAGLAFGAVYSGIVLFIAKVRQKQIEAQNTILQSEAQRERLARHLTDSRLKLMQAQVEPHFLFNTLASVQELAEERSPDAAALTAELIKFFREGLLGLREERTTLAREFAMIEAYLNIMRVRMGSRLQFSLDLPAELATTEMPPAMLISIVENAIKHGLEPATDGGQIAIRASRDRYQLVVEVMDTGLGHLARGSPAASSGGFGLTNIRERLKARYGEANRGPNEARLELEFGAARGCTVTLRLPLDPPEAA